jgi:hypothetical protein
MVHPADFQGTTLDIEARPAAALARLQHALFVSRLEKGVILRARVLGLFLARDDDMSATAEHFSLFSATEPPLTT